MYWDRTRRHGTRRDNDSKSFRRLRGKGAILLEVSHRPARVRFPPPALGEV